jgi:hypothetical protein
MKLVDLQSRVSKLVHRDHWIHRVVLYYYCVPAAQIVLQIFQQLLTQQLPMSECHHLLRQFGQGSARNGGDTLTCMRELWWRMEKFYPASQGWALHCAIVRLVVISLCLQEHPCALEPEQCLAVIKTHGPHLGQQDALTAFRVLSHFKAEKGPHALSAKFLKNIKSALRV